MCPPSLRDSLSDQGSAVGGGGGGKQAEQVLLVEDDVAMVHTLECYFANRGLVLVEASTIAEAKRLFAAHPGWRLVISDFHLPDGNGWEFCCWVRRQGTEQPPFLLISGAPTAAGYAAQVEFLAKPFSIGQLDRSVGTLLRPVGRLERELTNQSEA
jgi:DNA-binding response OmpR family regulator